MHHTPRPDLPCHTMGCRRPHARLRTAVLKHAYAGEGTQKEARAINACAQEGTRNETDQNQSTSGLGTPVIPACPLGILPGTTTTVSSLHSSW